MKIKVYKVYFGRELDKIFLSKKKALEYKENLELYSFDEYVIIEVEKGYVYVWCSKTNDDTISRFNTRCNWFIFDIWFYGQFIIWKEVIYGRIILWIYEIIK